MVRMFPFSVTGYNGTLRETSGAPVSVSTLATSPTPVRESVDMLDYSWMSVIADYLAELKREGFFPGVGSTADRKHGAHWPFYRTEIELRLLMSGSRIMAGVNPHGGGFLGGLSSYIIGTGMTPKCTPKGGVDTSEAKAACEMAQDVIDEFCKREQFDQAQTQIFEESQTDGDFFPKLYDQGGYATLRRALPELVQKPPGADDSEYSYGIRKHPDDQERPLAFYETGVDGTGNGDEIPLWGTRDAREARCVGWHIKCNIPGRSPRGVARGLPLFTFGTRDAFDSAEKLLRNAGIGTANRLAYTFLRQWETATEAQVGEFQKKRTDYQIPDVFNYGRMFPTERFWGGQIDDVPRDQTMIQPPTNPETQHAPTIAAMLYRAAGQCWNAPEWLMSGDSSNMAAYTAALVSGGPFVKRGTAAQNYYKHPFVQMLDTVLRFAVWAGRIPERVLALVTVDMSPPMIEMRDRLVEANRNQILVGMGVKSRQKVAEEEDLDFDRMVADNKEFQRLTAPQPGAMPGQGQPGQDGQGGTVDASNRDTSGQPQKLPLPGAIQSDKPAAGDLDPFGDQGGKTAESLTPPSLQSLRVTALTESVRAALRSAKFSGMVDVDGAGVAHFIEGVLLTESGPVTSGQFGAIQIQDSSVKPEPCRCDYPEMSFRNGSGHAPDCPIHQSWLAAGGFDNKDKTIGDDGLWVAAAAKAPEIAPTSEPLKEDADQLGGGVGGAGEISFNG